MASIINNLVRKAPELVRSAIPLGPTSFIRSIGGLSNAVSVPKIQHPAPNFEGMATVGDEFKLIRLNDFKGKYLILFFYPLDFTFVCPTELIAIEALYDRFQSLNTSVVGISIDSHYTHLAWMNTSREKGGLGKLRYPLLSDINKNIARDYNVLLEKDGVALRGSFLIDPKGILRVMTVNDLNVGRNIEEFVRIVEALQFSEEHGEVCPANWTKGGPTIRPDPKGAQQYFTTVNK
ncbi:peroxiredoxin-like [Onthophagus taurus]|uniref:peroxiredoxin-like n=1 Tax=Onthophagus taurus TaxID=166361 RepID=UPI000C20C847|nr:peroxiredoxin-2-like [Onthophagus taurus]